MSSASTAVLTNAQYWERYRKYLCHCPSLGLTLDISRMHFADSFFESKAALMNRALTAMDKLEGGAIANKDEERMVGHYWLRAPSRAPKPELRQEIESTIGAVKDFARRIHRGEVCSPSGQKFQNVLVIGNEAHGVSGAVQNRATRKLSIPMSGNVESLNAAVAGSICMFAIGS